MANGEEEFIEALRENGTMDMVRDALRQHNEGVEPAETPGDEPTRDSQPRDPETGQFVAAETEEPAEEVEDSQELEAQQETPPAEDEGMFLELTPEVEEYLAKHGGDLSKALQTAAWEEGVRGRQGNELGDLRKELEQLREELTQQHEYAQPYSVGWPEWDGDMEEWVDPQRATEDLTLLALEAKERRDPETMAAAMQALSGLDPFRANMIFTELRLEAERGRFQQEPTTEPTLEGEFEKLASKYPDIRDKAEAIVAEAERWPSLARRLSDGTPAERVQAIEDLYLEAARRTASENEQAARRRVAVTLSEEARQARAAAQVAQSAGLRDTTPQTDERPDIPIGETTLKLNPGRVDAVLEGIFGKRQDESSSESRIASPARRTGPNG